MEQQTRRVPKRNWSEEDKRIRQKMVEREQRRLEEDENQKMMKQRFEEEKEKIREERDWGILRNRNLTQEQKMIRKTIRTKARNYRDRLARAAKDEKYKQKLDACRTRGEDSTQRKPRDHILELTVEQKEIRNCLSRQACYHQADEETVNARNAKRNARYHQIRAVKARRGEIKLRLLLLIDEQKRT